MKAIIIRSNHGNHRGFDRHWDILSKHESLDDAMRAFKDVDIDENSLVYTCVITQDEYDFGVFNGEHMGYASKEIVKFFEPVVSIKECIIICPHCGEKMSLDEAEQVCDCGCPFCRRSFDYEDQLEDFYFENVINP